ncbi:protoporphyrinogen oxidase HemJ [Consotaella salsifontis]|uniref:Protoporphyrinogen IX oxidase n=1 Tax=Consotaella salsifontis TaxID=1365950 RepID=A0A1T4T4L2_9HYPH|nr:protoporphyrinogen oxidase HemJ [Consotaella salsifontis]SKA35460.1 putative membrane protein [Consotaella salsifontis]
MKGIAIKVVVTAAIMALLVFGTDVPDLWIKAFHIIAVISWMAGLFYLPRLFVYHTEAGARTPQSETFKVMEEKLLRVIINPAMIATWMTGLWIGWSMYGLMAGWLHAKLLLVVLLSGYHGFLSASRKRFARDENTKSSKYWRMMNEVPTVLMIIIVILVVVKPF